MQGLRISKIPPAKADDPRGPTYEWKFYNGENRQVTICVRKAGSISTHYHKGFDKSKNPERLFLVSGKIKITFSPVSDPSLLKGVKIIEEVIVEAGREISIEPLLIHKTEVLEDCIILEYRVTHFHPRNTDTFSATI